jgi:hypothetical protein
MFITRAAPSATYTLRDFAADDLLLLPLRDRERVFWAGTDLYDLGRSKPAPARTLLANEVPVVCFGLILPWPGLAVLWSFFSATAPAHRYMLWKVLTDQWRDMQDDYPELLRVETLTLEYDPDAHRVVEHLGFTLECRKPCYGPRGETFISWFWLRNP